MLTINAAQFGAFADARRTALATRIGDWLATELRGTGGGSALGELVAIVGDAEAAGIASDRDCALYALLLLSQGTDWRATRAQPPVTAILDNQELNARSKLAQLADRLAKDAR